MAGSVLVRGLKDFQCGVVAGGFPCQDISVANPKGKGLDGERSGLWWEMLKTIRMVRPKYVIVENVSAITYKGLGAVLGGLAEAGYDAEWFTLRASSLGALHQRERLFVVAYPNNNRARGQAGKKKGRGRMQTEPNNGFITDDWEERIQRFVQEKIQRERGFSWCEDVRGLEDLRERPDIPEPLFRGARDGIPDWVDRTKAIGNSVSPEVAEFIGRRIMEYDKE